MTITPLQAQLINALQDGFPLTERPFQTAAQALDLREEELLAQTIILLDNGTLTRFGPLYNADRMQGANVLAAMRVPAERFETVAEQVNAHPEVAHNYARDHDLNMWFVAAADTPEAVEALFQAIELETGLAVLRFPKEREYFVELKLSATPAPLTPSPSPHEWGEGSHLEPSPRLRGEGRVRGSPLDTLDRAIIRATQEGLPLEFRPYLIVAREVGCSEAEVIARMQKMLDAGVIRRIGMVPNHYRLGYTANGMTVWDVDDTEVDALGEAVGRLPFVSHCYRRPRALPDWPYNLFAMVHGHHREEAAAQAQQIADLLGTACRARDILYSTRILKKTGLRLTGPEGLAKLNVGWPSGQQVGLKPDPRNASGRPQVAPTKPCSD